MGSNTPIIPGFRKSRFVSNGIFRRLAATHAVVCLLLCGVVFASHAKQSQDSQSSPPHQQSEAQSFFGRIVSQNGVRFILRDDENNVWYHLDDQEKAAKLFGKVVLVTGAYDGVSGAIHVQNIVEAGPQDRPRPNNEDKKPDSDAPKMKETPPARIDANASRAPQAIPPPPLVIGDSGPESQDQISAETYASHHPSTETSADPAPNPPPASFFSLPEEPVSASSSVAVSSRRFISMPSHSSPDSEPPENLSIGKLLRYIAPAYPPDARQQRLEGMVRLRAVISEDGAVESLEPVSGPPLLVEAAVAAVRDWRYSPTLLDGQRIQTQAEIRLVYRLPQ
jgi:TonB family protein